MCDKLVYDLSQEVEGTPSVFVRKDWINMLDNQNQNYNNNQSVLDTSQICNSNKYMSYRESYLSIPFLMTLGTSGTSSLNALDGTVQAGTNDTLFQPATSANSVDYSVGLKNWFGQIIHSFTLDYNGTTIIQQTPYVNMWNSFKLMTSLSLDDVNVMGPTIGFFPDDSLSWQFLSPTINTFVGPSGLGTCNNTNFNTISPVTGGWNNFRSGGGNEGFTLRQGLINFDLQGNVGGNMFAGFQVAGGAAGLTQYGNLINGGQGAALGASGSMNLLWKSYISSKINQTVTGINGAVGNANGVYQVSIVATVYLKHIHGFFNMCPLLKGAFMKMTLNLNNTTTAFTTISQSGPLNNNNLYPVGFAINSIQNPLGGINPAMIASGQCASYAVVAGTTNTGQNGGVSLFRQGVNLTANARYATISYRLNICVGAYCLDQNLAVLTGNSQGALSRSIYLYIPSYTFNPPFEQAYLSSPIKNIKYTDIYQYQVINISAASTFNNLITNGIANIKSILVLPFYSSATSAGANIVVGDPFTVASNGQTTVNANTGFLAGTPVFQSPFDSAGTGTTSPFSYITNFNIQISGQNAIYNTEKYLFEEYNNQLYGQNAVNGGMTDGLNSGLVSRQAFDNVYNYYYVNVERMLPAEQSVPKSVQITGQNLSGKALDLYVFVEFGVDSINVDILTGARV